MIKPRRRKADLERLRLLHQTIALLEQSLRNVKSIVEESEDITMGAEKAEMNTRLQYLEDEIRNQTRSAQ